MAYYLQMDGVDDKLAIPSFAYDEVIFDFWFETTSGSWLTFLESPSGTARLIRRNGSNQHNYSGFTNVYIDDIAVTNNTLFIPTDRRSIMKAVSSSIASVSYINSNQLSSNFTKAKLYDIKFYNGGVLQAHYNMSTQTVQDQSGNGRHATLTGGTWVDDGSGGGTDVTVNSVVATNTVSMSSPTVTTTSNAVINSVLSQSALSAVSPTVDTQQQITLLSSVATFNAQSIPPSIIAESPNVSISSVVTSISINAVSPIIGIDNNVVSVALNAVFSANNPIVEILNDVDYYEQVLRTTFNINRSLETTFEINRSLRTTFKI